MYIIAVSTFYTHFMIHILYSFILQGKKNGNLSESEGFIAIAPFV